MKLTIRFFGALRERAGTERLEFVDLPDGLDVRALKLLLQERRPELGLLDHVRGVVGTSYVDDETKLTGADEVSFLPPVSGGEADLEQGVFEIHAEPLDPEQARLRVSDQSCGAALVFTGSTRERNRGEDVLRLDYSAFDEMAHAEMARIFLACQRTFGPPAHPEDAAEDRRLRMLVLHRTGRVEVGQPSVVVAVAAPHREAAFSAARFLIDELKKSVPFWKKEEYADGHHWIGDRS